VRVKIVLLSAEGRAAAEIAERLDCTGWRSEVWVGTQSTVTRRPSACARAMSASASASAPKARGP
jgi:hypothetical protein